MRPSPLLPLCMALLCLACAFRSLKDAAPLGGEMSLEREMEMTAKIHHQIRAQAKFVTDPVLLDYVNEIGQRIVLATEPQPFIYRFSILRSDDLNAFTIGGGYVYISSAVLAQAGDVAELAGVLAHEIAHVRVRHIAKAQENQGLATLVSLAAMAAVVLAGGDPSLLAISQGINVSMQIQHTRAAEAEADREGIEYMIRSGYSPNGMVRFFQRILTANPRAGKGVPPYLFTHPAIRDRIADARADIKRLPMPPGLVRRDARLAGMQARLALAQSQLAGGSGLHARASFERGVSDPYLLRARRKSEEGDLARADEILAHAQEIQPWDPRIALARATVSERRGDLEKAKHQLERAFEIDPRVPLVQYRLGSIHARLGNHSRAVFYLEQAAIGFNVGSSGRRRAELAIEQLAFPVLEASGLGGRSEDDQRAVFARGEAVTWYGQISNRFQTFNPEIVVRWTNPEGVVVLQDLVRMNPFGRVSSSLPTANAALGRWTVHVRMADSLLEEHVFQLNRKGKRLNGGL